MKKLTKAQNRVYKANLKLMYKNKRAPSLYEISEFLGFTSSNAVQEHLINIAKKGYIKLTPGQSRSIVITDQTVCAYCRRGD